MYKKEITCHTLSTNPLGPATAAAAASPADPNSAWPAMTSSIALVQL